MSQAESPALSIDHALPPEWTMLRPPKPSRSNAQAAAQYQLGLTAYESGRWAASIAILERIADCSDLPATLARFYVGRARLQLGLAELRARRFREAETHLRAAAAIEPGGDDLAGYLAAAFAGQ